MIENEVLAMLKILKVKAVSSRFNAFVEEFFNVAFRGGITEENVRTLRNRMRQQHKRSERKLPKLTLPRSLIA